MSKNKKQPFQNPFAALHLIEEDVVRLQDLSEMLMNKERQAYEAHLFQNNRQVDMNQWKFVKQKDDIKVYADQRQQQYKSEGEETIGDSVDLPMMLVVGSIEGTLDDAMYGVVNPTIEAMRVKSFYVDDRVCDAAVLATIVPPTTADPFRSLTIKWMENGQPLHARTLQVKNRDFVYMEATGLATLSSTDERFGFHILHSVHFPETIKLPGRVRANMSVCGIYRQLDNNRVDVYVKGILNPAGNIIRSLVIKAAANALISARKNSHCGQMKKLTWLVQRRLSFLHQQAQDGEVAFSNASGCVTCRSARKINNTKCCQLCQRFVCSSCKIKKKLAFISSSTRSTRRRNSLQQEELRFCGKCVVGARDSNALLIASDEVVIQDKQHDAPTLSSSEVSGSSSRDARASSRSSHVTSR